jgi:Ion channel
MTSRERRIAARLEEKDDFGIVLLLILATVVSISLGAGAIGTFISVCLSGFTLLFVLHTSGARRRTFRSALLVVAVAVAGTAVGLLSGAQYGTAAAGLIGLLLAFAAPVIIARRILGAPTITVRVVLGALAIYLLIGLTYAYLYPVISAVTNEPFFVQTDDPGPVDYVYFSYVTLTTVGFGDFTAATSVGRMITVSEALTGQLYLVSAVALLVGNIGRTIVRGPGREDRDAAADSQASEDASATSGRRPPET